MILAAIMVTAIAIFVMNLVIDIAYALLDPRIRDLSPMATVSSLKVKQMTSYTGRRRPDQEPPLRIVLGMLWRDKFATAAVIFLAARDPLRDPRPGAARRGRDQAEPARTQRPAVLARSRAG